MYRFCCGAGAKLVVHMVLAGLAGAAFFSLAHFCNGGGVMQAI